MPGPSRAVKHILCAQPHTLVPYENPAEPTSMTRASAVVGLVGGNRYVIWHCICRHETKHECSLRSVGPRWASIASASGTWPLPYVADELRTYSGSTFTMNQPAHNSSIMLIEQYKKRWLFARAFCCLVGLQATVLCAQRPNTVIVFNGGQSVQTNGNLGGYDARAEGLAWSEGGFLNDKGKPNQIVGGDIVDGSGNVVGRKITRGNTVIGWQSTTRNVAIIDINNGRFSDAWDQVAAGGRIRIVKHGIYQDVNGSRQPDEGDRFGGGIYLDNGHEFGGFHPQGTGLRNPYPQLTDRTGDNISLEFISCWANDDPDGAGAQQSIVASARNIPGVGSVTGNSGISRLNAAPAPRWNVPKSWGITDQQIYDAIDRVIRKTTGFQNHENWVNSLAFQQQYDRLVDEVGRVTIKDQTGVDRNIEIDWSILYEANTDPQATTGFARDFPQLVFGTGGMLHFTAGDGELGGEFDIDVVHDLDGFPDSEIFHLFRLGDSPAPAPAGRRLATGIYALEVSDGLLEEVQGSMFLEYAAEFQTMAPSMQLYQLESGAWTSLPTEFLDETQKTIGSTYSLTNLSNALSNAAFVVAGFAVPEPSSFNTVLGVLFFGLLCRVAARRCSGTRSSDRRAS